MRRTKLWPVLWSGLLVFTAACADQETTSTLVDPTLAAAPGGPSGNPFEHCRNASGGVESGSCDYTTGSVNQQTGYYFEGDGVPVTMVLEGVPTGEPYTIVIGFDHKDSKANKWAYDFPADYDLTVDDAASNPCNSGSAPDGCSLPRADAQFVPFNLIETESPGAENAFASLSMLGRTNLAVWGAEAFAPGYEVDVVRDDDRYSSFSVTFTPEETTVVLAFSGHLASEIYYGEGQGAGSISGAPIHHRWISDDGASPGNKELPLQQGPSVHALLVQRDRMGHADPVAVRELLHPGLQRRASAQGPPRQPSRRRLSKGPNPIPHRVGRLLGPD